MQCNRSQAYLKLLAIEKDLVLVPITISVLAAVCSMAKVSAYTISHSTRSYTKVTSNYFKLIKWSSIYTHK